MVESKAIISNPGSGPVTDYYTTRFEQSISTTETNGAFTMMRTTVIPHAAPPLHVHSREDEFWIVLSGKLRFWVGGDSLESCETFDALPGAVIYGPRHVSHTFDTITESSEVLIGNTPGAVEGYFTGVGAATERHDDDNSDFLAEFGVSVIGEAPDLHRDTASEHLQ